MLTYIIEVSYESLKCVKKLLVAVKVYLAQLWCMFFENMNNASYRVCANAGSMGLDKFGGAAWGGVNNSASNWSKPNESSEDDCIICMEPMNKDQTSLHCRHSFHTKVRKMLHNFVLSCCIILTLVSCPAQQ
jgi:hypothetical protein